MIRILNKIVVMPQTIKNKVNEEKSIKKIREIFERVQSKNNQENARILHKLNEILEIKRKVIFRIPRENTPIVLLMSGGLDSICLWQLLLDKFRLQVYPLYFKNETRLVAGEEKSIHYFSRYFGNKYPKLSKTLVIKNFNLPTRSIVGLNRANADLFDVIEKIQYVKNKGLVYFKTNITNFYFSSFFVYLVYQYLLELKRLGITIDNIFAATVKDECQNSDRTLSIFRLINLTFSMLLNNDRLQYTSFPLEKATHRYSHKKQLVTFSIKHNIPLEQTWSCTRSQSIHCGKCVNCVLRRNVFATLRYQDKTIYRY